jgi:hypothetical protein
VLHLGRGKVRQHATFTTINARRFKKWMLVPFGVLVGVVLCCAGLSVWRMIHPLNRTLRDSVVLVMWDESAVRELLGE